MVECSKPKRKLTVLYTSQLTKKHKTWKDGYIEWKDKIADLYSMDGSYLDRIRSVINIDIGDELKSEKYLVTIENESSTSNSKENITRASSSSYKFSGILKKSTSSNFENKLKISNDLNENELLFYKNESEISLKTRSDVDILNILTNVSSGVLPKSDVNQLSEIQQEESRDPSNIHKQMKVEHECPQPFSKFEFPDREICQTKILKHGIYEWNFTDIQGYVQYLEKLTVEHVNFQMFEVAKKYFTAYPISKISKTLPDPKDAINSRISQFGSKFISQCHCSIVKGDTSQFFLVIPVQDAKYEFLKDDLWVISNSMEFRKDESILCVSLYYGVCKGSNISLQPLIKDNFTVIKKWSLFKSNVFAIRIIKCAIEISCLKNIWNYFNTEYFPLLDIFCSSRLKVTQTEKATRDYSHIQSLIEKFEVNYHINEDQKNVLVHVANRFQQEDDHGDVMLINGVYGSGKSYTIALACLFIIQCAKASGRDLRILVSALTNVAVDNVLKKLKDHEYEDFVRVGNIKKIDKELLSYTFHTVSVDGSEETSWTQRSNYTLQSGPIYHQNIQVSKKESRADSVKRATIVGVTCASALNSSLDDLKFDWVILDECSQISEPVSLLSIARFQCKNVILVGDPMQLGPTISNDEPTFVKCSLAYTLFDRLAAASHKMITLKTQYRCHPTISNLTKILFYNNNLNNGVTVNERLTTVEFLTPITLLEVKGSSETFDGFTKIQNLAEASAVVKLISILIKSHQINPDEIGVISPYKGQAELIKNLMDEEAKSNKSVSLEKVRISTIDAFQGAEKDLIVLSCARTKTMGFSDSPSRTNVALTRSRRNLVIFGNFKLFQSNRLWRQILDYCQRHDCITTTWQELMKRSLVQENEDMKDDENE